MVSLSGRRMAVGTEVEEKPAHARSFFWKSLCYLFQQAVVTIHLEVGSDGGSRGKSARVQRIIAAGKVLANVSAPNTSSRPPTSLSNTTAQYLQRIQANTSMRLAEQASATELSNLHLTADGFPMKHELHDHLVQPTVLSVPYPHQSVNLIVGYKASISGGREKRLAGSSIFRMCESISRAAAATSERKSTFICSARADPRTNAVGRSLFCVRRLWVGDVAWCYKFRLCLGSVAEVILCWSMDGLGVLLAPANKQFFHFSSGQNCGEFFEIHLARSSGNIRIWKYCTSKGNHKLVLTALSSVQGHMFGRDSVGGDEECDDDEIVRAEISIVKSQIMLFPMETHLCGQRRCCSHNKHLKSIAVAYWKPQPNSVVSSLPSLDSKNVELEHRRRKATQARIPSDPSAWQQMRDNYEAIVLEDHAFSEQHEVEFSLWWQLHYKRIDELRAQLSAALPTTGSTTTQNGKGSTGPGPDRKRNVELEYRRRKATQARIPSDPSAWQQMQDNYEAIVLEDHAFSEQHEVEFPLWCQLHYKRIDELRAQLSAALPTTGSTAAQNGKGSTRPGPNRRSYSQLSGEAKASVKMVPVRLSGKGRGKDEVYNFGSDASECRLVIIRLIAILIFTIHNLNRETENQAYAEILQRSVLLQNAFSDIFELMGIHLEVGSDGGSRGKSARVQRIIAAGKVLANVSAPNTSSRPPTSLSNTTAQYLQRIQANTSMRLAEQASATELSNLHLTADGFPMKHTSCMIIWCSLLFFQFHILISQSISLSDIKHPFQVPEIAVPSKFDSVMSSGTVVDSLSTKPSSIMPTVLRKNPVSRPLPGFNSVPPKLVDDYLSGVALKNENPPKDDYCWLDRWISTGIASFPFPGKQVATLQLQAEEKKGWLDHRFSECVNLFLEQQQQLQKGSQHSFAVPEQIQGQTLWEDRFFVCETIMGGRCGLVLQVQTLPRQCGRSYFVLEHGWSWCVAGTC
ncbi:telomerase activating protein Est1 [Actinidia rufa]|uniref:Telomerase activating protein Est1 n=1 Tax=Actinidia rufa TaxID=165716 RepID=A0A7J0FBN8_9ERIC|nr:telomerase activating protein Est1 [Actinidia rufa]